MVSPGEHRCEFGTWNFTQGRCIWAATVIATHPILGDVLLCKHHVDALGKATPRRSV